MLEHLVWNQWVIQQAFGGGGKGSEVMAVRLVMQTTLMTIHKRYEKIAIIFNVFNVVTTANGVFHIITSLTVA